MVRHSSNQSVKFLQPNSRSRISHQQLFYSPIQRIKVNRSNFRPELNRFQSQKESLLHRKQKQYKELSIHVTSGDITILLFAYSPNKMNSIKKFNKRNKEKHKLPISSIVA